MRPARIELASCPWQGHILPLNHGRFLPPRGFEPLTLAGRRSKRRAYSSSATEARLRHGRELNPRIRVLQTLALPLGYRAVLFIFHFFEQFFKPHRIFGLYRQKNYLRDPSAIKPSG